MTFDQELRCPGQPSQEPLFDLIAQSSSLDEAGRPYLNTLGRTNDVYPVEHTRTESNNEYILKMAWSNTTAFPAAEWDMLQDARDAGHLDQLVNRHAGNKPSREVRDTQPLQQDLRLHRSNHGLPLEERHYRRTLYAHVLQYFRSLREFITVFRDAIQAHKLLSRDHSILHRDISFRNVMVSMDMCHESSARKGLLVDLDYAVKQSRPNNTMAQADSSWTGTLAFMACPILRNEPLPHAEVHDLESCYYVLVWGCTFLSGPNGQRRGGNFRTYRCFLESWEQGSTLAAIGWTKQGQITSSVGPGLIEEQMHPYFATLLPLIMDLRNLMFKNRMLEWKSTETFMHDDVLVVVNQHLNALSWEDPQEPAGGWNDKLATD